MLSKPDRERLAAIESKLVEDDPRLAELFHSLYETRRLSGLSRVLAMSSVVVVVALAAVCLLSGLVLSAVGLSVLAAVGVVLLRLASKPAGNRGGRNPFRGWGWNGNPSTP